MKPEALSTYEALADSSWEGRLCLRSSKKVYNQSLTATLIEARGATEAEKVLKGWVANLATDPFADDNAVIQAVDAGQCDVGIVNTYYYGRLHQQNPKLRAKLFWPNQADRGVHVNLSGIGLTRHAPHPEAAKALVEWMTTPRRRACSPGSTRNTRQPGGAAVGRSGRLGRLQGRRRTGGNHRQAPGRSHPHDGPGVLELTRAGAPRWAPLATLLPPGREPRLKRPALRRWYPITFAIAALVLLPLCVLLLSWHEVDREIWAHLWDTQLPRLLGNSLVLVLGVGCG